MFSYLNPLPQLPKYKGPHKVGSIEYEIPVSEIETTERAPDSRVTTIKFRIFYPTTASATSRKSIPWLPNPQKAWNRAYAEFMGASESRASWLSMLPSVLNHATIPAVQNAPLSREGKSIPCSVVVFSHGLGGNFNAYSSLVGSLASCGVVCVVPEHRDGSAPTSLIKSARSKVETTIPYQKMSHNPTTEVLNGRNAMLRVRLWELSLVYSAIHQMNKGKVFSNFADTVSEDKNEPNFQNSFDLRPSRVTWAGHSFGSATMVQFVKSIYYHKGVLQQANARNKTQEWDMTPLYVPATDSELVKQVTSESPVALLDLWTMPLRGETTRWLWEKPLPCYNRDTSKTGPNLVSIMSAEFYKWPELRNRTRAVLSENADEALTRFASNTSSETSDQNFSASPSTSSSPAENDLNEPAEPELGPAPSAQPLQPQTNPTSATSTRTPSPAHSAASTATSTSTSKSSLNHHSAQSKQTPVHLYLVPHSAHLSQSDFGVLFPNLTRYFMKALDPEKTMELNVRAILAMMRGCGLDVDELKTKTSSEVGGQSVDRILEEGFVDERWQRVPLID